ncbi:TRAP C4-dicarboxylate transport system permease DctM subunit [Leptothrix cholodnii SP-6]|uniref:TRAP C4-dicarboxylate transport system permease DctM subunit n=1 Tax=Leptothrix cholodnii (strain ATCC 51168 / LMG 8142 / SP-6) TaxID=395495 RepID=B1XYN6_LEPCP|nr:TRAP transporter large permease subunit [Leptothrix cholodnii]ACB36472.1 TRAP C4-dicarboxylate transport system permease DctM subunit [Leptothrix cholodnii SP-6]
MKIRKELWFGFSLMAIILITVAIFTPWAGFFDGHLSREDLGALGLLMLGLIVVAIMLGFPTAFTLMGMGVFFGWLAYRSVNPDLAGQQILDLMVQRAYSVMSNDVLIAIPLFVFMGYLVERANLIEKLFKSLHLALARLPGALAVATIVTCAIFATATGIVGAVVTLMGLLALPAMLRAGYGVQLAAGAITAGGCLGILIPPSVLLIVYGATAGVSVVKLYAGAFFPGLMLAGLYVIYVVVIAKLKPHLAPPLSMSEREVALPPISQTLSSRGSNAISGLFGALKGAALPKGAVAGQLFVALLPAISIVVLLAFMYGSATAPVASVDTTGLVQAGSSFDSAGDTPTELGGLQEPPAESGGLQEPPSESTGLQEPPSDDLKEPAGAAPATAPVAAAAEAPPAPERVPAGTWYWIVFGVGMAALLLTNVLMSWQRLEIFKMLLQSFFPLAVMIVAVLGSIVFGLATPTEAAAVGALGGLLLAGAYRYVAARQARAPSAMGQTIRDLGGIIKESSFLTAKTSAMVCWLFVGSSIFSAAFALLGGQELIEQWVLSLGLTTLQFMLLSQFIIFILGWPLEWTEIIVIFMPIFIPLLPKFGVDPLFFGLLVALNLQTAFLSPPVAMAAFYLKGVSPPHVTLNQIFAGMLPFMGIQVFALFLLYQFPAIGLWLPQVVYGR